MITLSVLLRKGQMTANGFIAVDRSQPTFTMERRLVVVYAGTGSSHSWTWLADIFEAQGVTDVRFVDTAAFTEQLTDEAKAVIISGGDGYRIASAIGLHGFSHMKGFIHRGGNYVGICAGAYLPLPSSIDPFDKFNLSSTKIENIDCELRPNAEASPRKAVRYGNCSIIHPVRGEIELESGQEVLRAPLYGGPIFKEPAKDEVLARYRNVTGDTELQVDRERASSMIIGKPSVIRSRHGHGELLLFGPHLEHPRYPEANSLFLKLIGAQGGAVSTPVAKSSEEPGNKFLERAIADLKVAIFGLENRSFLVGNKLWDGGRFLELVNAIERRFHTADSSLADEVTSNLMRIRAEILKAKPESLLYADEGPERLVEATRLVVDNHFRVLREPRNR